MSIIVINKEKFSRPIQLLNNKGYFATHIEIAGKTGSSERIWVVSDSHFQERYAARPLEGHKLFSDAPFAIELVAAPPSGSTLSALAYQEHALNGKPIPDMKGAFEAAVSSIDRFVSFDRSFAEQKALSEFLACWVISTYATDVFDTVGYIWPNGEKGSGKTQCLKTLMRMAFMGRTIASSSTFAAIRDEAALGATLGFDDCENLKHMDPNKRELLLLGNTKGAEVTFKEPGKKEGQWQTAHVNAYSPKGFTSIGLPDETLGSRTILIPLTRSGDLEKTRRKPTNDKHWECDPRALRDTFWLQVAGALPELENLKEEVDESSDLSGRDFDIFQAPLTVALWLERHHECDGLFAKMVDVMEKYHASKHKTLLPSAVQVVVQAMYELLQEHNETLLSKSTQEILFRCQKVLDRWDITEEELRRLDVQKIGILLRRQGLEKVASHGSARGWTFTGPKLKTIAKSHGFELEHAEAVIDETGKNAPSTFYAPSKLEHDFIPF